MSAKSFLKRVCKKLCFSASIEKEYLAKHKKFSFSGIKCICFEQYEACITRLYHTIEKGLSYENYRPGFGQDNINSLLTAMENYASSGYDTNAFFYETALSTLNMYVARNKEYGYENAPLEKRIKSLPGVANEFGGTLDFIPLSSVQVQTLNFSEFNSFYRHRFLS